MSFFRSFFTLFLAVGAMAPTARPGCNTGVVPIGGDCTVIPCASDATWDPATCSCVAQGTGGGHP